MDKTEEKRCATNQKETEEQLPKRDHKKALLTDMKSKNESISRYSDKLFAWNWLWGGLCLYGLKTFKK